jgi:subtilisin family serine protease
VAASATPDADYDEIGAIALSKNCLLVAAAGNDSMRPNEIDPVAMPANAKTFMAVGAINRRLGLYPKGNGGVNANGGNIDLVAPGVDVRSSKPLSIIEYGLGSGTSMATPHVAGLAALMMESAPSATAEQIWTRLTQNARRLPLPNTDVGAGLAQAG